MTIQRGEWPRPECRGDGRLGGADHRRTTRGGRRTVNHIPWSSRVGKASDWCSPPRPLELISADRKRLPTHSSYSAPAPPYEKPTSPIEIMANASVRPTRAATAVSVRKSQGGRCRCPCRSRSSGEQGAMYRFRARMTPNSQSREVHLINLSASASRNYSLRQLFANAAIAASRVGS
jgi:hypothetical protein